MRSTEVTFSQDNPPNPKDVHCLGKETRKQSPESEWRAINTIRVLAADMVQNASTGHPGTPMGLAPAVHILFSRLMRFNPENPKWIGRDRFIMSNGHGCCLQYILLHLCGYDLSLKDLKAYCKLKSKTPGHPEVGVTPGVEVTTGPLGQGFANAVGMALSLKHLGSQFNQPQFPLFSSRIICTVGNGCLQEGVSHEAAVLAAHWGLGRLVVIFDDNRCQIDGRVEKAESEDVLARFHQYGWRTFCVEDGDNDLVGIQKALEEALQPSDMPAFIKIRTTIGYGSLFEGTHQVHGSILGAENLANVKLLFEMDPNKHFEIDDDTKNLYNGVKTKGREAEQSWKDLFERYKEKYPLLGAELSRRMEGRLPEGWQERLPRFPLEGKPTATREFSGEILKSLHQVIPELVGGSADLAGSTMTLFGDDFQKNNPSNRFFYFGVREHAMAAICNGIAHFGCLIPFCSTFLVFLGYAFGAIRVSALSKSGVIYIATHDSVGLGEDGPTHQPVEALSLFRATPHLLTMRPADSKETRACYIIALKTRDAPVLLSLTRQPVPFLQGTMEEGVGRGAYIVSEKGIEGDHLPDLMYVATGSEVALCVQAASLLEKEHVKARVVSMPINKLFDRQPLQYKLSLFPPAVPVISVEAQSTFGWNKYSHFQIGIDAFGYSGSWEEIYQEFGLTPEAIAQKGKKLISHFSLKPAPSLFLPDL